MKRSEARDRPAHEPAAKGSLRPQANLAGALHEVSNALTVVLGWLDAARSKLPDGPAREALEVARTHADLGYRVARSAIGAEVGSEPERRALSVAHDTVRGVLQQARSRRVRVVVDDSRANDAILRDASSACQILMNLLLNAIAFTPVKSTVTLSLVSEGSEMAFRVADQGPGVDPDVVDSLFSGPRSTRSGGAGIGLAYSAGLAESRGGELRLAHAGPGAIFELCWPIAEARSLVHPRPVDRESLDGMRVLVIEDDAAVQALIEFALDAHGVSVTAATSPAEVVELLSADPQYDAALVDLSPFADDASEALSLLESAAAGGAALILISGVVTRIPDELEGRIAAWVRKPFEMNEVVRVLEQIRRASTPPVAKLPDFEE